MTTREFVESLHTIYSEPMTYEEAAAELKGFYETGWYLPDDITTESYHQLWNELCETVRNSYNKPILFSTAVQYMEDEIREAVHMECSPCSLQDFFEAYATAYFDAYGEEWICDTRNPQI